MNIFKKIFDHEYKELERFKKIAREIAGCVAAVGLAIVIYCTISLLGT